MNPFTHTSLVLVLAISSLASGCAHRAKSLRLLDARSNYNAPMRDDEAGLFQGGKGANKSLLKQNAESARVYLHPTRLPTGDFFWGGYISLSLKGDDFDSSEFESLNRELDRPAIIEVEENAKKQRR